MFNKGLVDFSSAVQFPAAFLGRDGVGTSFGTNAVNFSVSMTKSFNSGGDAFFNVASAAKLVVTSPGIYYVWAKVGLTSVAWTSAGMTAIGIRKNGSRYLTLTGFLVFPGAAQIGHGGKTSLMDKASAGDYYEMYYQNFSTGAVIIGSYTVGSAANTFTHGFGLIRLGDS